MWRYWKLLQWSTFVLFLVIYPLAMIHLALRHSPSGWMEYDWALQYSSLFAFLIPVIVLFRVIPMAAFHVYRFERSGWI